MAKHHITLAIAIVLAVSFYIITIVLSALAALGKHPFLSTTGNISDEFVTQITPSGWTFTIWSIIYIFMGLGVLYVFAGIFRKNAYGYVYCSPAVLPHGFFGTFCLNLGINVGWLLLWDRKYTPAALAFLILIALTNYAVIFFSCYGLHNYGAWLNKYHKTDLLLHHLLIQNGIAIYATWTTIASLLNLTIVLTYDASLSHTDAATLALSVLFVVLIVWFILENSILDKYVRFILSIYPTVIWALTGVFTKNYNTAAPTRNNILIAALLGVACALCATRICLVIWRQMKKPLYGDVNPDKMSPMEILEKQKKIFKFVLENLVFDKHVRYICITYPFVVWVLSGNLDKHYDAESPSRNGVFIAVMLVAACVLFVIRLILVVWRHIKQPLYEGVDPEAMEPMEIAEKQKKIFR